MLYMMSNGDCGRAFSLVSTHRNLFLGSFFRYAREHGEGAKTCVIIQHYRGKRCNLKRISSAIDGIVSQL